MKFTIDTPLREWLEQDGTLEAYEENVRMFLRTRKYEMLKRPLKKLTEGFNFMRSFEGRAFWVEVMKRAPKEIGGMQ